MNTKSFNNLSEESLAQINPLLAEGNSHLTIARESLSLLFPNSLSTQSLQARSLMFETPFKTVLLIPDIDPSRLNTHEIQGGLWEAKNLINREKALIQNVSDQCGDLKQKRYGDEDLESFMNQVEETPFFKLDTFFNELVENGQVTQQQKEAIQKKHPHFFEDIPQKNLNALDIFFWIELLNRAISSSGKLLILYPSTFSPYEQGAFLEELLMNPNLHIEEKSLEGPFKLCVIQKLGENALCQKNP